MSRSAKQSPSVVAEALAARLVESRDHLIRRWLERITARVTVGPNRIFPSNELLNHVPILIDGLADYIRHADGDLDADQPAVAKAMELGALRHTQGFDAYEILKEYELLGAIILAFMEEVADDIAGDAPPREIARVWRRVAQGIDMIRQATMTHFLRLSAERVREREERLRRFNRMVAHELKNRVGAVRGAANLLLEPWLDATQIARFHQMILDNALELQRVLENLSALSRLESDTRQRQNVLLPQAIAEAFRQLRESADANGIRFRVGTTIPPVEVDAAAIELCVMNYLSNAIKYADRTKPDRWVEVDAELQFTGTPPAGDLLVWVRDNGIGVPADQRERLFEQFFRVLGEGETPVEGTGLGLSIVRDTVTSLGGRAWVEFPESGETVFAFSLPSRREADAAAAGTRRPDGALA
ncbi:MAG TPA: sensor histidine kinase [Gemmatimonadaceae bacterium]|jgi:signal transduction histidine kinase